MRIITSSVVVLAISALTASFASAALYTTVGGAIPDNAPAGPLVLSFVVTDPGAVANVNLTLTGLTHTWAGDIIATLKGPGGAPSASIMTRPGSTTPTGVGDSTNFGGTYRFIDSGADMNAALALLPDAGVLAGGDYKASFGTVSPIQTVSLNTIFGGVTAAGTWTLSISDNAAADTGALGSATLSITVPEPATLSAIAGLSLAALRRRR